jgi:hypothetical protein
MGQQSQHGWTVSFQEQIEVDEYSVSKLPLPCDVKVKSEGGRFQTSASGNPAADSQAGCEANAIEESDVSYAFKEENGGSPSQSVQSPGTGGPSVMASPGTAETSVIAVDASELAEASGCHPTPASALQAQGGSSGGGRCLADTFSERFQAEATKLSLAQTYPTTRVRADSAFKVRLAGKQQGVPQMVAQSRDQCATLVAQCIIRFQSVLLVKTRKGIRCCLPR